MEQNGKIPVVIIGLGRIASLLEDDSLREKPCTHAGAAWAQGSCVIAGGMDTDSERRRLFARRWAAPVFDNAALMLTETRPQIVCVATPPDSHERYCALAARFKTPLVICEKPLASTKREAEKICAIHRKGETRILLNHERRYSRDYQRVQFLLRHRVYGRLISVSAKLFMGKATRLLDMLWHDGTHLADIIMFAAGDTLVHRKTVPSRITARRGSVFLLGTLKNTGAQVMIETGAERDHLVFELCFSCERGAIRIGNGLFEIAESVESPYAEGFRSLRKVEEGFEGPTGYFSGMFDDAVRCVRERMREPLSSALTGLAVIRYLNSVRRWA